MTILLIALPEVMVRPLRNQVYIEKVRREASKGGILIPQTFDHQARPSLKMGVVPDYFEAKVVEIGPDVRELAPGDRILVWTYAEGDGSKLYTGEGEQGDRLFIKYPDDILCAIDNAEVA